MDRARVEVVQGIVCVQRMKFFLCLNSIERGQDVFLLLLVVDMVPIHVIGDVGNELGKEGDLGQLVEGDEAETVLGVVGDVGRWGAVGDRSVCSEFDRSQLRRIRGWEVVSDWIVAEGERSCQDRSREAGEGNQGRGDESGKHYGLFKGNL